MLEVTDRTDQMVSCRNSGSAHEASRMKSPYSSGNGVAHGVGMFMVAPSSITA